MAYEDTEPRNNQILLWGVVSVVTLFALVPVFHSYFGITFGGEMADKVYEQPNTAYEELRDGQKAGLRTSPIPVGQAMEQLASRGRANTPVMPRPNDAPTLPADEYEASLAPVVGWGQLQQEREAEEVRRAMRWRRQQLGIFEEPDPPDETSLEDIETESADAPSSEVETGIEPVPAQEPVEPPPSRLVRPTAMVAGGMAPTMAPDPAE